MQNTIPPAQGSKGKTVLFVILGLVLIATILFWTAIQVFQVQGLTLYFMQLGLYLIFFGLAYWGIRQEQISLPVTRRKMAEALGWSLVGWLVFVLLIQLAGLAKLPREFAALQNIAAWKIALQMVSTWIFVGMGEELLFRGYILKAFWRYFTGESDRRRMLKAALLSSAFFSLWHLPARLIQMVAGELDWVTLLVSLLVLFLLGLAFTYLYIRSDNILLTGWVHGLVDLPLVGKNTQVSFIIILVAIGCVEIARWTNRKKAGAQP